MHMKPNDLQNKSSQELKKILEENQTKLARLSFEKEANTLKDTSQIKKTKKDIARILTFLKVKIRKSEARNPKQYLNSNVSNHSAKAEYVQRAVWNLIV